MIEGGSIQIQMIVVWGKLEGSLCESSLRVYSLKQLLCQLTFIIVLFLVMINKAIQDPLNCSQCNSVLDNIGTQAYCPSCLASTPNVQQELRVVPEHYQSNCGNKRVLQKERKYNALIRQFSDKHRELTSKHELESFRQKLRAIKSLTVNRKGSREAAAVVVYCEMNQEIKMTIRQYCKSNNLNVKLFNQKYKIYKELERREPEEINFMNCQLKVSLKLQENNQKLQQSPTQRESQEYFYSQSQEWMDCQPREPTLIERAEHALNLVYSKIFNKYIYRDKKTTIIGGLLQKFEEIDKTILKDIKYHQNTPFKIYYLIFAVLKELGHRITFLEYSQIILKETGYALKKKPATLIRKLWEKTDEKDVDPPLLQDQVKIEENCPKKVVKKGRGKKKEKPRVDLSDFDQFQ